MAAVAQLVERQIVALNVAGSIPVGRPNFRPLLFFQFVAGNAKFLRFASCLLQVCYTLKGDSHQISSLFFQFDFL